MNPENEKRHKEACEKEELFYTDSDTGLKVLTSFFLLKRGYCCKSFCRHCPYGYRQTENTSDINE